jgi:predicted transcriptional regulator
MASLGELEKAVMNHLWGTSEPQTVRQVHEALSQRRELAYTTVMTVLQRLAKKSLVVQQRDDRAHKYVPVYGRDELIAGLMVDALQQADAGGARAAALVHFVGQVGSEETAALREALAKLEADNDVPVDKPGDPDGDGASNDR